jgi:hypothetical protein
MILNTKAFTAKITVFAKPIAAVTGTQLPILDSEQSTKSISKTFLRVWVIKKLLIKLK